MDLISLTVSGEPTLDMLGREVITADICSSVIDYGMSIVDLSYSALFGK